jgi:hypothetical protein
MFFLHTPENSVFLHFHFFSSLLSSHVIKNDLSSGTSLSGYTGFYGRQLALLKEKEAASRASRQSVSATAAHSAATATAAAARSVSVAAKTSSLKQTTTSVETKQTSVRSEQSKEVEQRRVQFLHQQEQSVKEGRQSASRCNFNIFSFDLDVL